MKRFIVISLIIVILAILFVSIRDKRQSSEETNIYQLLSNDDGESVLEWIDFMKKHSPRYGLYLDRLDLKGKSEEEIREELFVDFSTLDPYTMPTDPKMTAKILLNLFESSFRLVGIRQIAEKLHPSDHSKYDLRKFNSGIVGLGVENFMKAASQFCEEEADAGRMPIVSVGSGDGTVERGIIAEYRQRYGKDIRIQLVDPDPQFDGIVDFKTVDHLIKAKPNIVGNCVAFIIWPDFDRNIFMFEDGEDHYDIEAVRKLQPKAVLIVYESTGGSGSNKLRGLLHEEYLHEIISREEYGVQNYASKIGFAKESTYGLDNYSIVELARQKIFIKKAGTAIFRMVKMMRTN